MIRLLYYVYSYNYNNIHFIYSTISLQLGYVRMLKIKSDFYIPLIYKELIYKYFVCLFDWLGYKRHNVFFEKL